MAKTCLHLNVNYGQRAHLCLLIIRIVCMFCTCIHNAHFLCDWNLRSYTLHIANSPLIRQLTMEEGRLYHQYGSITNTALSPIWLYHQYGYITNTALSPIRLYHQYGSITNTALSPIRLYHQYGSHQYGSITNTALSPIRLYHQYGSITNTALLQSATTAHR